MPLKKVGFLHELGGLVSFHLRTNQVSYDLSVSNKAHGGHIETYKNT